ncbi:MAG: biopolymer transporter ExbD [Acidobacteriia bacterium]|jgi:biopolymer transport protein ExbD/biopolymer transport protein TolR|nr:biopolymer transporter ExbD [Terriglobia bacterium]
MKKPVAPQVVSEINVTPMVDVMLVLLIIFIVITPLLTKGQTVEFVKAKNPIAMQNADKEDAILISVTRNGQPFLSPGNKQVGLEDIPTKVQDLLTNKLDKTVYIRADARAKYQAVEDVVDRLRAAGVDQLGLITETPQGAGQTASATPVQ